VIGSGGRLDDPRHPDHRKLYVQNYIDQFDVRKVEANALVVRPAAGRQLCLDTILKYLPEGAPDGYQDRLEEPREHLLALCLILIYAALSAPLPCHQTSGFVEKTRGRCGSTSEQTTTGTEVDEPDPETETRRVPNLPGAASLPSWRDQPITIPPEPQTRIIPVEQIAGNLAPQMTVDEHLALKANCDGKYGTVIDRKLHTQAWLALLHAQSHHIFRLCPTSIDG